MTGNRLLVAALAGALLFAATLRSASGQAKVWSPLSPMTYTCSNPNETSDAFVRFTYMVGPHNNFQEAANILIGIPPDRFSTQLYPFKSAIEKMPKRDQTALAGTLHVALSGKDDCLFARIVLARLYAQLEEPSKASEVVSESFAIAKGDDQFRDEVGWVLNHPAMKDLAEPFRKRIEGPLQATCRLINLAYNDKSEEALPEARALIKRWPKSKQTLETACNVLQVFKKWDEALAVLQSIYQRQNMRLSDWDIRSLGDLYLHAGNLSKALELYMESLKQGSPDAVYRADTYRGIVGIYIDQKKYDMAAATILEAEKKLKRRDDLMYSGVVNVTAPNIQPLVKELEHALAGTTGFPATRLRLGELYIRINRMDSARQTFSQLKKEYAGDQTVLYHIRRICMGSDTLRDLGLEASKDRYKANPNDFDSALTLAADYRDFSMQTEALAMADEIVNKLKGIDVRMSSIASLYDSLGQHEKATAMREKVAAVGSIEDRLKALESRTK